jgi:hypothetical protein
MLIEYNILFMFLFNVLFLSLYSVIEFPFQLARCIGNFVSQGTSSHNKTILNQYSTVVFNHCNLFRTNFTIFNAQHNTVLS